MAYDQDFFLALAAKGKEAWNEWRRDPANKDVPVTFAGIDFSEAPRDRIDFSGFEFGDRADFSGCKWRGVMFGTDLTDPNAFFTPGSACITGAAFGDFASFIGAAFGDYANFDGAGFGDLARFYDAVFGDWASFKGAFFGDLATFADAAFGKYASFAGAVFGKDASFDGAAFGDESDFDKTFFKGRVQFTGKSIKRGSRKLDLNWDGADDKVKEARIALKKLREDSWTRFGSGPDRLLAISFGRARFDDEAIFSRRTFEGDADFTSARFYRPPDFDAAANAARIDFSCVHIGFARPGRLHWTSETRILFRLRALRKFAEDTKNHDLERDLYIEERKAERGVYLVQRFKDWVRDPKRKWALIVHILWIAVMGIYWALADYGRSFARPAVWLVSSGFFFYWCYGKILAPLMPKVGPLVDKYAHVVGMVALGNAVPFVGPLTIDSEIKKFLFCPDNAAYCLPPIPPEGYQWLVLGQIYFRSPAFFSSVLRCAIILGSSDRRQGRQGHQERHRFNRGNVFTRLPGVWGACTLRWRKLLRHGPVLDAVEAASPAASGGPARAAQVRSMRPAPANFTLL